MNSRPTIAAVCSALTSLACVGLVLWVSTLQHRIDQLETNQARIVSTTSEIVDQQKNTQACEIVLYKNQKSLLQEIHLANEVVDGLNFMQLKRTKQPQQAHEGHAHPKNWSRRRS